MSTDRARPPLRPDSSVVERHLGKMEVPGSIPGRGSDKPVSSEAGFFVCPKPADYPKLLEGIQLQQAVGI